MKKYQNEKQLLIDNDYQLLEMISLDNPYSPAAAPPEKMTLRTPSI